MCPGMDVASFYKDRSVLITGATGFMGKVLVEKLLRSCPDLKKIYVLIRPKGNKTGAERIKEIVQLELFNRIHKECPWALSKLVALEGDMFDSDLGLNAQDLSTVVQEVSVIIHLAANVKFKEPLRIASNHNLEGTINTTDLARKIPNLKAFVYVSTAYANGKREFVEESFYTPSLRAVDFLDLLKSKSDEELLEMTPHLIQGHPYTYTFTKHLAENYLDEHCRDLPLAITRPAVKLATWKDPFAGWTEEYQLYPKFVIQVGKGVLKALRVDPGPLEIIPVDVAVNQIIVSAWNIAITKICSQSAIPILNGVSSPINNIWFDSFFNLAVKNSRSYPLGTSYRYPYYTSTRNQFLSEVFFFCNNFVPAAFLDTYLCATGKEPLEVRQQKTLYAALKTYNKFAMTKIAFSCKNVLEIDARLNEEDKREFPVSVKGLDWESYMRNYIIGIRRFVLQENDSTLPAQRQHLQRLYRRSAATKVCLGIFTFSSILHLFMVK